jgi:hypothetical protein
LLSGLKKSDAIKYPRLEEIKQIDADLRFKSTDEEIEFFHGNKLDDRKFLYNL